MVSNAARAAIRATENLSVIGEAMTTDLKGLSSTDRKAVEEFCFQARQALGRRLVMMKLFGSKARGDASQESDIDIFIVVDERVPGIDDRVIDIAFDLNLKYGVYISPRVVAERVLKDPVWKTTLFLRQVAREGLAL